MPLEPERVDAYSEPDVEKTPAAGESSRESAEDDWLWMIGVDPALLLRVADLEPEDTRRNP